MLDKKYKPLEKQEFWKQYWKENKIYYFDKKKVIDGKDTRPVYSVDTPPPTVSRKHTYRAYFLIFTNRNDSKIQKVKRI